MYILDGDELSEIEETTFRSLGKKESNIEELLRKNIDVLCEDEESLLIVGQQVCNAQNGRSDLTAIDNHGNLVLIEIKRDRKNMEQRREPLEFQAIRYAASCAAVKNEGQLVQDIFAPYVEKHKDEFRNDGLLTSSELAARLLKEFLNTNNIDDFNKRKRIMLVASDFDPQTISAVAWLNSNQVDISCFRLIPYKMVIRSF